MFKFWPPAELLEKIGFGKTKIGNRFSMAEIYVGLLFPTFKDRDHYRHISAMFIGGIKANFSSKIGADESRFSFAQNLLTQVLLEALMNVAQHGNKKQAGKDIKGGYWAGERGFIIGIKDDSDFFKGSKTKELFEARKYPHQGGLEWVFDEHIDEIYVSTEEGVLYLVFMVQDLLI